MARVMGWGSQFNDEEKLPAVLREMEYSSFHLLDRWSIQYSRRDVDMSPIAEASTVRMGGEGGRERGREGGRRGRERGREGGMEGGERGRGWREGSKEVNRSCFFVFFHSLFHRSFTVLLFSSLVSLTTRCLHPLFLAPPPEVPTTTVASCPLRTHWTSRVWKCANYPIPVGRRCVTCHRGSLIPERNSDPLVAVWNLSM